MSSETFRGLELRNIGPALMSGRIADIVKDPTDRSVWYVAVASGGVWKTTNAATTWQPIFDDYDSYSVGSLALDPTNPQIVWVGTGENNSQRSVGWGDGIYKSLDGGESFDKDGSGAFRAHRQDRHRSSGLGSGLGGLTGSSVGAWWRSRSVSNPRWRARPGSGPGDQREHGRQRCDARSAGSGHGLCGVLPAPAPPVLLVAGGPGVRHLQVDRWRRELAPTQPGPAKVRPWPNRPGHVAPEPGCPLRHDPGGRRGWGILPSANRGESWVKTNDYVPVDPQYYQEIFPDPHFFDRVYVMDVWIHVSDDGGKSFAPSTRSSNTSTTTPWSSIQGIPST